MQPKTTSTPTGVASRRAFEESATSSSWHKLAFQFVRPLASLGWRFRVVDCVSSRKPVVLLYHGVPLVSDNRSIDIAVFESHILFIKRHFEFVNPEQVGDSRGPLERIRVLLTFDDGYCNQFEVAKRVLLKHNVPAVFFISSRHAKPGAYLWNSHTRMLADHFQGDGFTFRGMYFSMAPEDRESSIGRLTRILLGLKPHPSAMYRAIEEELPNVEEMIDPNLLADRYRGMSAEQVADLAREPQFTIGCHTVDHSLLTLCAPEEAFRQIADNVAWLERVSRRKCKAIAYPCGDYNAQILDQCRDLDFIKGFAVVPKLGSFPQLEVPRIGIYSTRVEFLGFKVQWGNILRKAGIAVG